MPRGDQPLHRSRAAAILRGASPLGDAAARTPRRRAGCPSARSSNVCCNDPSGRAPVEQRRARVCAVSSSESGDSESVRAFGLPPPHARSPREQLRPRRADDRAAGRPVAQSTRWSTKSSRPSSAKWRSSKTSTSGRCSASASKKPPPGGERLAAPVDAPRSDSAASSPTSGRRFRLDPLAPRRASETSVRDRRAQLLLPHALRRRSRACLPAPSPSRRAPSTRRPRRTGASGPDASDRGHGSASTRWKSSDDEPALADARGRRRA